MGKKIKDIILFESTVVPFFLGTFYAKLVFEFVYYKRAFPQRLVKNFLPSVWGHVLLKGIT